MKKFRRQPPYKKDGKTNFLYTKGKAGVYLIYKGDKPVYIGHSKSDVYKTMYRHFQSWSDPTQTRITYVKRNLKNFSCRVVLCTSSQAVKLEKLLILKHKPKDNTVKYEQYKATKTDVKLYNDFVHTPLETCPF